MIKIRQATTEDLDLLFEMIIEIAQYHDSEHYVVTTREDLLKAGFSDDPKFGALIATYNKEPAGYVSYTHNYSIWLGENYLNIDDVFVKEVFRGKKIGEALMQEIKAMCSSKGIKRVKWEVEEDNTPAIRFYERLGAKINFKGVFNWDLS